MTAQLALDDRWTDQVRTTDALTARRTAHKPMCAACKAREARYGFRGATDDPQVDRPRTLCFECFRVELGRRQEAAQAVQGRLPLEQTLDVLRRRRQRAQIAARRALAVSGL